MSTTPAQPQTRGVREPVVLTVTPFKRTKLREEIAAGRFPAPKKFSERVVAWDAAEVHRWIEAQREKRDDAQATV